MKNYSTKAFYNYARKLVEGDAAATVDVNADFERVNSSQFRKMVAGAGVGIVGALACLKYLDKYFSVAWLSDTATFYKKYAAAAANESNPFFMRLGASLRVSIGKALQWVLKMCGNVIKHAQWLKKPIISGSEMNQFNPSYGSVLSMALVASAVGAVLYKVYKVIKSSRAATESVAMYKARQIKGIKKALKESNAMFGELTALTEYTDKELALDKAIRAKGVDPAVVDAEFRDPAAMGFVDRMKMKIEEMWLGMKNLAVKYPVLTVMVGVCAALIACWYGVKKYKEYKANSALASESVKPSKKTRRTVRRSAYSF